MTREICKLNVTVLDHGDTTEATGSVSFDGTGQDMVYTLAHLFELLELGPMDATLFSLAAVETMKDKEEA